jgi:hypothetical protein
MAKIALFSLAIVEVFAMMLVPNLSSAKAERSSLLLPSTTSAMKYVTVSAPVPVTTFRMEMLVAP